MLLRNEFANQMELFGIKYFRQEKIRIIRSEFI